MLCQCRIPKMSNNPRIAMGSYAFYKSKHQVKDLLDSLIYTKEIFFWQEGRSYLDLLLNLNTEHDTITYSLAFAEDDLEWVNKPDSTHLLLGAISKYQNRKDEVQILGPKMDSSKKKMYQNIFDSIIIKPLKIMTINASPYKYLKISVGESFPSKWLICKSNKESKCDTIYIDDNMKGRYFGRYQIIPKDSL